MDHIILGDGGGVKYVLETKISETPPQKAQEQLTNALDVKNNKIVGVSPEQETVQGITADDFKNIDRENLLTVGPSGEYDVQLPYTSDAYKEAFKSARIIQEEE